MRTYYIAKCIKTFKETWIESDCDGDSKSDMIFNNNEYYRIASYPKMKKPNEIQEYILFPDNEWDGTYRYIYMQPEQLKKYFEIINIIEKDDDLQKIIIGL